MTLGARSIYSFYGYRFSLPVNVKLFSDHVTDDLV